VSRIQRPKRFVVEQKQLSIDITEAYLAEMDAADAAELAKANEMIGEHFANLSDHGRGKDLA
jgi:hypothetical protein